MKKKKKNTLLQNRIPLQNMAPLKKDSSERKPPILRETPL